ncbi:MAG: respiratory nitrate reductase subunit gamma [Candidatus Obscuribacterales bacterium]|nr:respiratory nitrate reductase subunit gamma [Candidatus Obscuribacterales bacterium]
MLDSFLFVGLPYISLAVCVLVTFYRLRHQRFAQSALSSQFLENKQLLWGSMPWHIGIAVILLAHFFILAFPGLWQALVANKTVLYIFESAGIALSMLALVGLAVLLVRRITSARIQAVTTTMDLVILLLLLGQVVLGMATAGLYRWGSAWAVNTAVPYVWSLILFKPEIAYVTDLPPLMKGHIIGAWLLLLLIPFSRLIHVFALPLQYLFRPPQKVVWMDSRHQEGELSLAEAQESRRYFLRAALGIVGGACLLFVGAADKLFRFFFGPRLSQKEEASIMSERLSLMQKTVEQKKYELERQQNDYIFISKLSDLSAQKGKYFIDYAMTPALAFLDKDNLPLLLSAKCTHLGCTVGSNVDADGKILCPCHISYFDIHSGMPNPDSPAKAPLPHIGWVLMDQSGKMVASKTANGKVTGNPDLTDLSQYSVFVARYQKEDA